MKELLMRLCNLSLSQLLQQPNLSIAIYKNTYPHGDYQIRVDSYKIEDFILTSHIFLHNSREDKPATIGIESHSEEITQLEYLELVLAVENLMVKLHERDKSYLLQILDKIDE